MAIALSCFDKSLVKTDRVAVVTTAPSMGSGSGSGRGKYHMTFDQFVACLSLMSTIKQQQQEQQQNVYQCRLSEYGDKSDSWSSDAVDNLLTNVLLRTALSDKPVYSKLCETFNEAYDNIPLVTHRLRLTD